MPSPGFQQLASRFRPYVEELHAFFAGYDVAFGSACNVPPFINRISGAGSFRDGLSAMVRAVFYREQEAISHGELLELILVAVAGEDVEEETPVIQEAERTLAKLIGQAMMSLWNMPDTGARALRIHPSEPEIGVQHDFGSGVGSGVDVAITALPDLSTGSPRAPACKQAAVSAEEERDAGVGSSGFLMPRILRTIPRVLVRPSPVGWASPPKFVWVASFCAFLLPIGIDFVSHAPAAEPVKVQRIAPRITHREIFVMPPVRSTAAVFDQLQDPEAMSSKAATEPLELRPAEPRHRARIKGRHSTERPSPSATAPVPAGVRGFAVPRPDPRPKQTDMPGADHGWTSGGVTASFSGSAPALPSIASSESHR